MITHSDLILINATLYAPESDCHGSNWIAATNGCVTGYGKTEDLTVSDLTAHRVIDCGGGTVLPGFVDAHLHLAAMAKGSLAIAATPEQGIHTITDLQQAIARQTDDTPPGDWIRVEGYHEFDLLEKRQPHRSDLDEAAPAHPVKLTHRSGHAHVLNTRAMDAVGIRDDTGDPPGGMIDRDVTTGLPSGLLYEMGRYLADRIPPLSDRALAQGICRVNATLLSNGITTVCDVSVNNTPGRLERMADWVRSGRLSVKVHAALGIDPFMADPAACEWPRSLLNKTITPCGVKIIVDETTGRLHPDQTILNQWVTAIHKRGGQVIIHAIEESAIAAAVLAIETAVNRYPRKAHRHRIEHCAVCPPSLIDRIADLGIRIVSQPGFLHFNGDRYLSTVDGNKQPWLYPFKSMSDHGIRVAAGSDAPVAPVSPISAIAAGIDRLSKSGKGVNPIEAIDLRTAVNMHTINSAEALFMEKRIGSLAMGQTADMVVVDQHIERLPQKDLGHLMVTATIIDGKMVYGDHQNIGPAANR